MSKYIQIITNSNKRNILENIANILINNKLAACIKITEPVTSIYTWKGKKEIDKEYLCIITTKKSKFKEIVRTIKANHNYEVPEIISIKICDGEKEYLEWIDNETKNGN